MKVLVLNAELCTGCGICEQTCAQTWFREHDADKASIRITRADTSWSALTCSQCGTCIDVCPTLALARDKRGVVRLDRERCVSCLACVGFCSTGAMHAHRDAATPFKCVACGACTRACPLGALSLQDVVDAELTATEKRLQVVAR